MKEQRFNTDPIQEEENYADFSFAKEEDNLEKKIDPPIYVFDYLRMNLNAKNPFQNNYEYHIPLEDKK